MDCLKTDARVSEHAEGSCRGTEKQPRSCVAASGWSNDPEEVSAFFPSESGQVQRMGRIIGIWRGLNRGRTGRIPCLAQCPTKPWAGPLTPMPGARPPQGPRTHNVTNGR